MHRFTQGGHKLFAFILALHRDFLEQAVVQIFQVTWDPLISEENNESYSYESLHAYNYKEIHAFARIKFLKKGKKDKQGDSKSSKKSHIIRNIHSCMEADGKSCHSILSSNSINMPDHSLTDRDGQVLKARLENGYKNLRKLQPLFAILVR